MVRAGRSWGTPALVVSRPGDGRGVPDSLVFWSAKSSMTAALTPIKGPGWSRQHGEAVRAVALQLGHEPVLPVQVGLHGAGIHAGALVRPVVDVDLRGQH